MSELLLRTSARSLRHKPRTQTDCSSPEVAVRVDTDAVRSAHAAAKALSISSQILPLVVSRMAELSRKTSRKKTYSASRLPPTKPDETTQSEAAYDVVLWTEGNARLPRLD